MAPPEFADKCARPACPIRGPHGAHCPRIRGARLEACPRCKTPLLVSYWYPLGRRPTCPDCRRFPTDAEPDYPVPTTAADYHARRLAAAEATMRLRALATNHNYTGANPASDAPWRIDRADERDQTAPTAWTPGKSRVHRVAAVMAAARAELAGEVA